MPTRRNPVDEARRRAHRQLDDLVRDLRDARMAAGLSQARIGLAVGVSRQLVSLWERRAVLPDQVQAAAWGATIGLDVPVRSFPGGSPLRDAGHLRVLARAQADIGSAWRWRTEVSVSNDPLDRRAIDAVVSSGGGRIGLEIITRLTDAQAQVRAAMLKRDHARLDRMLLVVADTRFNREAQRTGEPSLTPAFPILGRAARRQLRAGQVPATDGLLFV